MRKLALLLALAALSVPVSAAADGTSVVSAFGCIASGGHVTRPAGTDIVVRFGWIAKTPGLVQDYLQAQASTLAVNDGPTVDVSGTYGAPIAVGADWGAFAFYDTGVVLAPGQSMTFATSVTVSHRLTDGIVTASDANDKPAFGGPGALFAGTCTVTGV